MSLKDALQLIDETTFLEKSVHEGDVLMRLRPLADTTYTSFPHERLRAAYETLNELIDEIQDYQATGNEAKALNQALKELREAKPSLKDALEQSYQANTIGNITAETTTDNKNTTITVSYRPQEVFKQIQNDQDLQQAMQDEETAWSVAQKIANTLSDIIDEHPYLVKANTTIETHFVVKDRVRMALNPAKTTRDHIHLKIALPKPMIQPDKELNDKARELLTHELTHAFDDAQFTDLDSYGYQALIDELRREGLPTFTQNALTQDHYKPSLKATLATIQDLLKPLPDDLEQAHHDDPEQTRFDITQYASGRAPYDLGKAMIDLIYYWHLDKTNQDDTKERRETLITQLRHTDPEQLITLYTKARKHYGLEPDTINHILQLAQKDN